jgi:hypothetical protein
VFSTQANSSAYSYTSRVQGEPAEGVQGFQVHPLEPFSFVAKITATF